MKTIAVASGKGGTGKTTLTSLFARIASRTRRVVTIDADVEASNLPIALEVHDVECTPFEGMPKAVIDPESCAGCGDCEGVCRFGAIERTGDLAYRVDPALCEGCGRCVTTCRVGAIGTVPSRAGEACVGTGRVGPIAFGQLGPGEDLSGRLVTEVRRLGAGAAAEHDAELVLVDGPPGTGCPLTAAIANTDLVVAVTEPTVSGVHDLGRLADVAAHLGVPVCVVLNKADLSEEGSDRIRALCAQKGLRLVAEVPFDEEVVRSLRTGIIAGDGSGMAAVAGAWREIERISDGDGAARRSTLA